MAVSAHADYITMLRHPVDRIVSLYYYIRRRDQHALQHLVEGRSLAEFAAQNAFVVKNDQVRYVSGEMASAEPSLERAKQNLDAMIAFGIAERFDESVLLFRRRLGWSRKSVCYRRWNVTSDRPRLNEIPSRTLQIIEEQNQLDVALYDHARARFEELTRAQEEGFWSELSRYRFVNRLYAPVSGSVGAAARLVPQPLRRIARDTLDPFRRH